MGTPSEPGSVQLIAGILAASPAHLSEACAVLAGAFGAVARASEPRRWTISGYYRREMGEEIWRQFVALATEIAPQTLADIKRQTNAMEEQWRGPSGRRVNLDPGYLDLNKLVVASTKDAAHRIYLRSGIYAEVTLHFAGGSFRSYPHTYPDYAAAEAIAFFNQLRLERKARRVR